MLNIHYPDKWMTELLEIEKTYTSEKSTHVYLKVQYVMDGFELFINQEVLSISKSTGRIFSWEDRGISSVQWKHDVNEEWLYDMIGHHSEAYTLEEFL